MSGTIVRTLAIAADHPAFAGHFPGRPILPGVVLLAEVLEAARADPSLAAWLGAQPTLAVVKFLATVEPGARLDIAFDATPRSLDFRVSEDSLVVASGKWTGTDGHGGDAAATSVGRRGHT